MVNVRRKLETAKAEIEDAIKRAEEGTYGEVVVVVCRKAGQYGRQESLFAFLFAVALLSAGWWLWQGIQLSGEWDPKPRIRFGLGFVCLTLLAGFVAGHLVIDRFPKLVTLFVRKETLRRETEKAAALAYRRYKVDHTKASTGVLLFFAEVERVFVVLGDSSIAEKIKDHEWESIRDTVIEGLQSRKPVEGLIKAVDDTGALLKERIPCEPVTENERPDRVYFW